MEAVTDLRDLRVLIPQVRRAIDGPTATGSAAASASLNDTEVLGLAADATGDLILLTGGSHSFGYQLVATERDALYMAPTAWATDRERSVEADRIIVAQAALNHFFYAFRDYKIHEAIQDEGQQWDWDKSPTLVRDQLKMLQAVRDRALEMIALEHQALDGYVSFVAERDMATARIIEPWVAEVGGPSPYPGIGPGGGGGGFELDARFGSWWG